MIVKESYLYAEELKIIKAVNDKKLLEKDTKNIRSKENWLNSNFGKFLKTITPHENTKKQANSASSPTHETISQETDFKNMRTLFSEKFFWDHQLINVLQKGNQ